MRVTNSMIKDQIIDYLMDSGEGLSSVQKQLSTNKEVARSSDDPVRFERAGRFRSLLAKNDQYLSNIEDGIAWIKVGTESLDVMYEALQQVRELGQQTRSDAAPELLCLLSRVPPRQSPPTLLVTFKRSSGAGS